jgi:2'-5' RNA ligase
MKRRIFVAVNLPDNIKKSLERIQEEHSDLPAKWTKTSNLHITMVFLGEVADEDLMDVFDKVSKVASENSSFSVRLESVTYGPPKKIPPRMVWANGKKSKELGKIQKELEESLSGILQEKERGYTPHITLARIKTWQWKGIDPEERPDMNQEINLNFDVVSIEVMESYFRKGGPQYEILESFELND